MSALSIQPTFPIFTESDGLPLENGYIWIGAANLDPQGNPIAVYWDAALTIAAPQPIRTLNGYPSRSGTPARLYVNSDYSIRVQNSKGSTVYSAPAATERYSDAVVNGVNAQEVVYDPPFPGGVQTNAEAKLAQTVSPEDFGADPTGSASSNTAIQSAIDYLETLGGGVVEFQNGGAYIVSGQIRLKTNVSLRGNGCTIYVNPLNYTGGITRFYGVFSTVDITARPLPILWRIGNGVISYENILIDSFTFQINRDGNTLTSGQMDVAEINVVRFEDARNCKVTNCQFLDGETISNNNGSQVVFFVRSEMCEISSCYSNQTTLVYIAECKSCVVADNVIPVSVGTGIETVAGQSHKITNNKLGITWWAVSSIGINSQQCQIQGNTIDESALTGITVGHPTPTGNANFYNLPLDANFSTCRENYILSGDNLTTGHGYIGILVQAASYITVADNAILNLRKKTAYTDRAAGVLVQPDTVAGATGLRIEKNRVSTANNGVHVVRAEAVAIEENSINDVYGGVVYEATTNSPRMTLTDNFVNSAERAVSLANGYVEISGNFFSNITSASFSLALSRGHFRVENNFLSECGEMFFGTVKSLALIGNVIENAVTKTRAGTVDNSNQAGTATINLITVVANDHPGTTDMLRITNVLDQSTRVLENTVPVQFRTTSYNVGSLPTASAGLSAGDLWNSAGTVKVV